MKSAVGLAILPSTQYDARFQLAADVLAIQRRFAELNPPNRNRDVRNAHVQLALLTLEELLRDTTGRVESDLRYHLARILTNKDQIDRIADEADRFIHDLAPAPGLDLVDTGLGIALLDNVAWRVAQILRLFSPDF